MKCKDLPLMSQWTFLTNHTHVLIAIRRNPHLTVREIAGLVGITERSVQRIIGELEDYGVVSSVKDGRRNRYILDAEKPLRHPLESLSRVSDLLNLVGEADR